MKRELHNSCCKTISITQVAINNMKLFTALALMVANAAAAATDDAATPARLLRQNGSTTDLVEAVHTVTDVAVQVQADADKVRIAYFVKNCCPNCHLSHMFEHHYCSHDHHVHPLHLSLYTQRPRKGMKIVGSCETVSFVECHGMDDDQLQERCNNLGSGGWKPELCVEQSFTLYCCVPSPSLVTADVN